MTHHHLVQKYAERPPVNGLRVSIALEQLWGNVFGCTTEGYNVNSATYPATTVTKFILFVFSVSDMFSLQSPKSHNAMCPV